MKYSEYFIDSTWLLKLRNTKEMLVKKAKSSLMRAENISMHIPVEWLPFVHFNGTKMIAEVSGPAIVTISSAVQRVIGKMNLDVSNTFYCGTSIKSVR